MRFALSSLTYFLAAGSPFIGAFAPYATWSPHTLCTSGSPVLKSLTATSSTHHSQRKLHFSVTSSNDETVSSSSGPDLQLSAEDEAAVKDLYDKASGDASKLQELVAQALPTLHPRLIVTLSRHLNKDEGGDHVQSVAQAMRNVLDTRLKEARDVLETLLNAGEIRKLDAAIGKAAREGQLDMAFFNVLNMNLQDAATVQQKSEDGAANRLQILQHIYTRCQEEVEKAVPPGAALLNKLLRTEIDSIRKNQLQHYLCPQPNVIKSPDGKEIKLDGAPRVLVPPSELVDAMANAVKQIRTVEKAGGTDPASAAGMVESMRKVAMEARMVIGESYGVDSEELKTFEEDLMPVFRPTSPNSPYIQGN